MKIKDSKLGEMLFKAWLTESQNYVKYTMWAERAEEDGFWGIKEDFEYIAHQEYEHAERLWKMFRGGDMDVSGSWSFGRTRDTLQNLISAIEGESDDSEYYYEVADYAESEGYDHLAETLRSIAQAEKHHRAKFLYWKEKLETGTVFHSPDPVIWQCLNCGYLVESEDAPDHCPSCGYPQKYFAQFNDPDRIDMILSALE